MNKDLLDFIAKSLATPIKSYSALSGGDISQVYLLKTDTQHFLLKTHRGNTASAMLLAEKTGLEKIAESHTVKTPKVYAFNTYKETSFLLMEYIESKNPDAKALSELGEQLAALHHTTHDYFGLDKDNFIGSLPQSNENHKDWTDFYVHERLIPQLQLSKTKRLLSSKEIPNTEKLLHICKTLFGKVAPSLLHGDLWNGNYMIASDGTPYLIDPAVYYGHSEVDIAMSRLFGGFGTAFYEAYFSVHPPTQGGNERNDIYQLYYLLVHLNLFGRGYYASVRNLLKRYF